MDNYEVPKGENLDEMLNDPQVWDEAEKEAQAPDGKSAAKLAMAGFKRAAMDPSEIQKTMQLANDPDAMKQAQQLMQDPEFKQEMNQILEKPEFKAAMERARNMFSEIMNDPEKMGQLQEMMSNPEKMAEMQQQYMQMFSGAGAAKPQVSGESKENSSENPEPSAQAEETTTKKKRTRRGGKKKKEEKRATCRRRCTGRAISNFIGTNFLSFSTLSNNSPSFGEDFLDPHRFSF